MSDRLIGGRYRLLDLIAAGGFGEVWRAHDELLKAPVAIKRIKIDPYASTAVRVELISRARAEARNAAALRDEPNVVAVYDVATEDGLPWVVMRLVDGVSLAQELGRRTRLEPERAHVIALGVLSALRAAHRFGIVHRDVKPANILLAADGQVLLADFGIAKHHDDVGLTSTGTVVGSLEYMAPERFGEALNANGPAADLFSLGATLFETVEGTSPFRRTSVTATMAAVAFEPHPPLRNAGPLTALIERMLAKRPEDRPTADDAIAALQELSQAPTVLGGDTNPPPWNSGRAVDAATEFDVVLNSAGDNKIQVIKVIRGLTSLGLKESKDLVDRAPGVVLRGVDARTAADAEDALRRVGAAVKVRPDLASAGAGAGPGHGPVVRIEAQGSFDVVLDAAGDKKIQVIKVIRELTSLGLKESKDLVDRAPRPVLLGVGSRAAMEAQDALRRVGATVTVRRA